MILDCKQIEIRTKENNSVIILKKVVVYIKKLSIFAFLKIKAFIEMAKKSKDARIQVILECTEHKESGMPGTSRYITTKNKKNTPDRIELKKYNPILKRMTIHREIK